MQLAVPRRLTALRLCRPRSYIYPPRIAIPYTSPFRATSTATAAPMAGTQNEWLVILPDKPDAVSRRLAVRSEHLAAATERVKAGVINFGGIMLHDHPVEGETPKFKGSIMLLQVPTREDVVQIIKGDKYVENDVWDLDKMEIYPFRTALRKGI